MRRAPKKISLEEYFDFFESRNHAPLTVYNLNQILTMHGFMQLHKVHKNVMVDAVNTIELIDPRRSTLGSNIVSRALMTLEQVIADLRELDWQECSVTSLETIDSSNANLAQGLKLQIVESSKSKSRTAHDTAANNDEVGGNPLSSSSIISKSPGKLAVKRKRKRKRRQNDIGDSAACSLGSCQMEVGTCLP